MCCFSSWMVFQDLEKLSEPSIQMPRYKDVYNHKISYFYHSFPVTNKTWKILSHFTVRIFFHSYSISITSLLNISPPYPICLYLFLFNSIISKSVIFLYSCPNIYWSLLLSLALLTMNETGLYWFVPLFSCLKNKCSIYSFLSWKITKSATIKDNGFVLYW